MGAVLFPPTIATKPTTYIFKQSFFINLYVCMCVYKNKCKKKKTRDIYYKTCIYLILEIFFTFYLFFFVLWCRQYTDQRTDAGGICTHLSTYTSYNITYMFLYNVDLTFLLFFSRRCLTCSGSVFFFFMMEVYIKGGV